MKHKIVNYLPFFLLLLGVIVGCDDDDASSTVSTSPDVAVASFSLVENDSVLDGLSGAFFSIDLIAGAIYNADSLPYGTDVSELAITMTFASTPADVTIYTCAGDTIDYYDDETIEMDFTSAAKMLVTAPDEVTQKYYSIQVNVHTVVPDSLYWSELSSDYAVPATAAIQAMKVVNYQDQVLALVESDSTLTCYTAESAESEWSTATTVTGWYDVNTLQVGTDALYILDGSNTLYTSVDGVDWISTFEIVNSLIGVYPAQDGGADQLLVVTTTPRRGVYKEGVLVEETTTLSTLFPVSGFSNSLIYESESAYSSAVYLYIMGGETASGALTNAVWAYNGTNWSAATMNNLEMDTCAVSPRKGAALFAYKSYPTYEVFDYPYVEYDTWIVMGGIDEDG